jgi:hypothetical protein
MTFRFRALIRHSPALHHMPSSGGAVLAGRKFMNLALDGRVITFILKAELQQVCLLSYGSFLIPAVLCRINPACSDFDK